MNDAQSSGANGGLRAGGMSPDELDKIAALFVPTWELPADASAFGSTAAAIPPPPDDVMSGAMQPAARSASDPKKTQMGIAAPMQPAPEAPLVPPKRAGIDPLAPTSALDLGAVAAQPAVAKPRSIAPAMSLADQSAGVPAIPRKRSPMIFVVGGGVVVAAAAIFFLTRGPDKPPPKTETTAPITESKKLDLPDPNSVSTTAAATTTTATATAAATTATAADTTTAAPAPTSEDLTPTPTVAKTAEPPPAPPPKMTATAKPPPAPPPKMTATAAPKPPPAATATTAKPPPKKTPQKIKDEF